MPPVRPFRIALYLSLGLAILALGMAGGDLLPEIPYLTALGIGLLGAAYAFEGRWQLSLRDANLMGLALAALLLLWGVFQFVRPPTGLVDILPWPASALPYLAPVLMILIPAKMFRPKHTGDYWAMHGLALLAMAMASALAQDGLFFLVFVGFAVCFVWSLAAFQLVREAGPAADRPLAGGRWRAVRPAVLWAGVTGLAAVPLFWATPRTGSSWELGLNARGKTTGLGDGPVDLNTTGSISVNQDRAFEVRAETRDGQPVLDLPADIKWRVIHLQRYEAGRWGREQFGSLHLADRAVSPVGVSRNPRQRLPDFGPRATFLTFTLEPKLIRTPPLADPVAWRTLELSPAVSRFEDKGEVTYKSWVHRPDGSVDGAFSFDSGPPQYVQTWMAPDRPGYGPAMRLGSNRSTDYLTRVPGSLVKLRGYTDRLVERLVREGTLPPGVLTEIDADSRARDPKYHEAIGRALEQHLASSGEFTYTLDLARQDKGMDPTEDFVLNTRSGHCQRFATALVLMLRTQGVPTQMVIGYRGHEARGDGWYDVREDHAHAWAEILVPASADGLVLPGAVAATPLPPGWQLMRWVTLDPTPEGSATDAAGSGTLLGQARQRWEAVFKALLLAYNQRSREEAAEAIAVWLTHDGGAFYLAGGAALMVGLWAWRRWARRRRAAQAGIPDTLRRLVAVLGRAGYEWSPGQTAREWARAVSARLRAAGTTAVAGVPELVVAAYYADRFGGRPIGTDQRQVLDADVRRLAAALA